MCVEKEFPSNMFVSWVKIQSSIFEIKLKMWRRHKFMREKKKPISFCFASWKWIQQYSWFELDYGDTQNSNSSENCFFNYFSGAIALIHDFSKTYIKFCMELSWKLDMNQDIKFTPKLIFLRWIRSNQNCKKSSNPNKNLWSVLY